MGLGLGLGLGLTEDLDAHELEDAIERRQHPLGDGQG